MEIERGSLFCIITMICLLIIYIQKTQKNQKNNILYIYLLLIGISIIILDNAAIYYVNAPTSENWIKGRLIYRIILLLDVLYSIHSCLHIINNTLKNKFKKYIYILVIIELLSMVIILCSKIRIKYALPKNYYIGSAITSTYLIFSIISLFLIYFVIKHRKEMEMYQFKGYLTAVGSVGILKAIEYFKPNLFMTDLCIMLFSIILFLVVENPDVKNVIKMEQEKKAAIELSHEKSLFISTVSHELRTPMNAIIGMTELLENTTLTNKQQEYAQNIKIASNSLLLIVNDILDYNKMDNKKLSIIPEQYNLQELLKEIKIIINTRIENKPIVFNTSIKSNYYNQFNLIGDKGRLKQILINLLNNAAKFTESGEINLETWQTAKDSNHILLYFKVSDTGQGIKKEDLSKLFTAFGQVDKEKNKNKEGTGLGLVICKELVELQEGEITVRSEYGKGTEFVFFVKQEISEKIIKNENENTNNIFYNFIAPTANVLVVDDNRMNLNVAKGLFELYKINTILVENGFKAIEILKEMKFDIIFMDKMMPEISGEKTIEKIYKTFGQNFKTPIVALTADITEESITSMKEVGCVDFISKPIDKELLKKILIKYIDKDKINYIDNINKECIKEKQKEIYNFKPILDIETGIQLCGSEKTFLNTITLFIETYPEKENLIKEYIETNQLENFTIEVHSMKTSMKLIGSQSLSERFKEMEEQGKAAQIKVIKNKIETLLEDSRLLYDQIYDIYITNKKSKEKLQKQIAEASEEELKKHILTIKEANENFDLTNMDKTVEILNNYQFDEKFSQLLNRLKNKIATVDIEEINNICNKILEDL